MKKTLLFCLLSASFPVLGASLLPAGGADLVARHAVAAPLPAAPSERAPLAFSWALDPFAEVSAQPAYLAESREYWAQVDAAELRRGYAITTTAPGAVIRISPAAGARPVAIGQVQVSHNGRAIPQPQSFQRQATAAQLQQAGMPIQDGSAVMQLADEHGQGRFQLSVAKPSGRYLVHVFEPNSAYVLQAQAGRENALAGDTIEVSTRLAKGDSTLDTALGGLLVSPSGKSYDLAIAGDKARVAIPGDAASEPGLWEVQLFAGSVVDGSSIQRDARTAIAVAQPTAKLAGDYRFEAANLRFRLPVQVAAEGRYELRGTLFATGPDGIARPVSEAHGASWLGVGKRSLALSFDRHHLPLGYGAPFELRHLRLADQTRHGTLETRLLAAREGRASGSRIDRER